MTKCPARGLCFIASISLLVECKGTGVGPPLVQEVLDEWVEIRLGEEDGNVKNLVLENSKDSIRVSVRCEWRILLD